jgi:acyl-CoA synthetase (AMP-forming)/AMP-acid ligase II
VIGLDDARLGQVPVAAVRPRSGFACDAEDVRAFATEHLAAYKVPRRVLVVDDLPHGGTGKVQKDRVRALFGE